ncbi:MAG: hypothetical protein ACHP8A_12875, partial [Terriglobales bacterium]
SEAPAVVELPSSDAITSEVPVAPAKEVGTEQSPSEAEVMAAVASLSPAGTDSEKAREEDPNNARAEKGTVTALDAALAAVGAVCGPRWIAEPVPLSDGDSHLILESEMEKTYAALAAAESAQAVVAAEIKSNVSASENAPVGAVQGLPTESFVESQLAREVRVEELTPIEASEPAASENAVAHADSEPPSQIAVEPRAQESVAEAVASSPAEPTDVKPESVEVAAAEDTSTAYREIAYAAAASGSSSQVEARRSEAASIPAEFTVGAPSPATAETPEPFRTISSDSAMPAAEASGATAAVVETAHVSLDTKAPTSENESQLAAAWQNWRQIRESVAGPQLTSQIAEAAAAGFKQIRGEEKSDPQDTEGAASNRAAAEASTIAGIVDSVFAELKPKLMQEIARKLAEDRK